MLRRIPCMITRRSLSKRGRSKSGGHISEVTDDVDQLSSNKAKKVIKKEKNP
ncbi:hypothetical protein P3L10_027656 [Capsicum annuum]